MLHLLFHIKLQLDTSFLVVVSLAKLLQFDVKCGSLTDSQFSELKSLLLSYTDVFSKTPNDLKN